MPVLHTNSEFDVKVSHYTLNIQATTVRKRWRAMMPETPYIHTNRKLPDMETLFTQLYKDNAWGSPETRSGDGSTIFNTSAIRAELPLLFNELGVSSVLDIPCGDLHWMKEMVPSIRDYTGADIVRELVEMNTKRFGSGRRRFVQRDITKDDLPNADLVFTRDCFVHLSFEHVFAAFRNLRRSGSKYILATTFLATEQNEDIQTGDWRPINLQKPPFCLPPPERVVREHRIWDGGEYSDKALGLWYIADLPI